MEDGKPRNRAKSLAVKMKPYILFRMEETSKCSVHKKIKPESLSTLRQEIELQTLSLVLHIVPFLFPFSQ
jgi:hypothetical protein